MRRQTLLVPLIVLMSAAVALAQNAPFQGKLYDVDADHGNDDCQLLVHAVPVELVLRTMDQRLMSVACSAFEKSPMVSGSYHDNAGTKQLVSLKSQVPVGSVGTHVVYAIEYSTADNYAQVLIRDIPQKSLPVGLKVRNYNLQQICESSFRSGKPLYEIAVDTTNTLTRAKLNSESPPP